MGSKPLLICMTPVRNEAWVMRAFLTVTSLWADYIIVADQLSTDGSREIASEFPKVRLINNLEINFNEAERQKLLIDEARKIEGDKILFGLDADEVFSANFIHSNDWKLILNSKPGDVFWLRWANLCSDKIKAWCPSTYYPWIFHDDGLEPHGNYVRNMHSMRIPYPIEEKQMYYIDEFKVLHFAYLSSPRTEAKLRFYKFIDFEMNKRNVISLSRMYKVPTFKDKTKIIPTEWLYLEFNIFSLIKITDYNNWFDEYIYNRIHTNGISVYKHLNIYQQAFLRGLNEKDPRTIRIKVLHYYLSFTNNFSDAFIVKGIDQILKLLFK